MPVELQFSVWRITCDAPLHGDEFPRDIVRRSGESAFGKVTNMGYRKMAPYGWVCPRCVARIASDA